ncbi:MAG: class I SAM-dependent methyltransferase [Ardenticatenaceae bacterium]|nr:class I SAM-dependent methyltransferase [Ardenticatenaceae bacterium]
MSAWEFACPRCGGVLTAVTPHTLTCPHDNLTFTQIEGIWRLLLPERAAHFQQFITEYETVRQAEGWGSQQAGYYRALPQVPADDPFAAIWHIRARSFQALTAQVLGEPPLRILDLGAGNGWLSHRLAQLGHEVAAVDVLTNGVDGLGAMRHYEVAFTAVQAEFDHLPFAPHQADLVIFNGSFHYTADYEQTLVMVKRVLRANGRMVIMDSPIYHNAASGQQMVAERAAAFAQEHGFRGDVLPHEGFMTFGRLAELAQTMSLRWHFIKPAYGWRWAVRPWLARLRRHREPATFLLVVGEFV